MNIAANVVLWFAFAVGNYYAIEWACRAMTYKSDITFVFGLFGLILLITIDTLIFTRVFRRKKETNE